MGPITRHTVVGASRNEHRHSLGRMGRCSFERGQAVMAHMHRENDEMKKKGEKNDSMKGVVTGKRESMVPHILNCPNASAATWSQPKSVSSVNSTPLSPTYRLRAFVHNLKRRLFLQISRMDGLRILR